MKTNGSKTLMRRGLPALVSGCRALLCGSLFLSNYTMKAQSLSADLRLEYFYEFFPTLLNPGGHPTGLNFSVYNGGFDDVANNVNVEVFLSRNNTFGDADDVRLGQMTIYLALPWGYDTNVVLDAYYADQQALLNNYTIPSSACGWYTNMYIKVSFPQNSGYTDSYPNNNFAGLGTRCHVQNATGPAPTVQSIVRLSPTAATNSASSVTWRVTFSQSVNVVTSAGFSLTRLDGSISGYSLTSFQQPSSNQADVTANTGTGSGVLRLDVVYPPAAIQNTCEVYVTQSYTEGQTYTLARTGPAVLNIVPVSPDPMHGAVSSVDVAFSGPINLASFTYQDITLTRDGKPVPLDSSVNTSSASGNTYHINNLATFTTLAGNYVITVNGTNITDSLGNPGTGSASDTWNNILPGSQTVYINKAYSGSDPNGSASTPFKTVTDGYNAAQAGNAMTVFSGNYNEAILMNKQLLLQATNGTVNIGVP